MKEKVKNSSPRNTVYIIEYQAKNVDEITFNLVNSKERLCLKP